jgi:hypothetical protein
MAVHGGADFRIHRLRILRKQLGGLDRHAVVTVATLDRLLVNERLLHWMQKGAFGRPFCPAYHAGNPSSVVTDFPTTAETGVTQERRSTPSTSTEHDPHWARPHPKRGPFSSSSSEST